jgi:hypothetical protein
MPYTNQWMLLKKSRFFSSGEPGDRPCAGSILHTSDSSQILSLANRQIFRVFIRDCYIQWFNLFLESIEQRPIGKFALSSTPGCGKTFATNYIFKMASTNPYLCNKPILYQYKTEFFYFRSDKVFAVDRGRATTIAQSHDTFYILDGYNADPVSSECLTLFISSPCSSHFEHWCYEAQITPLFFPVWSLDELQSCRDQCYHQMIDRTTVDERYEQYGGIPRFVFWDGEPPSIEAAVDDMMLASASVPLANYLSCSRHRTCCRTCLLATPCIPRTSSLPFNTLPSSLLPEGNTT